MDPEEITPPRGRTVREFAALYRVSKSKVLRWIAAGELKAINIAERRDGKPRWVITPDAQAEFERDRTAGRPASKSSRRRRLPPGFVDHYPD